MKFGLNQEDLKTILNEINQNLGETKEPKVYIYGSRAKGNFRKYSDIDILLSSGKYDEKALSGVDFDKLDIPYKIDFVLDKDLFEDYRDEVHDHMILLSSVQREV